MQLRVRQDASPPQQANGLREVQDVRHGKQAVRQIQPKKGALRKRLVRR